jgi:hypothetical protein
VSYSWDEYAVAYETADLSSPEPDAWKAVVKTTDLDGVKVRSYDLARREYSRMKANEILYPEMYRDIRLMKQTTTVFPWEDVSP